MIRVSFILALKWEHFDLVKYGLTPKAISELIDILPFLILVNFSSNFRQWTCYFMTELIPDSGTKKYVGHRCTSKNKKKKFHKNWFTHFILFTPLYFSADKQRITGCISIKMMASVSFLCAKALESS